MSHRDRLPGGLADERHPSDFNKKELARGVKVELEHTNDPEIAREIAMDHLEEDEAYYEKLATIERNPMAVPQLTEAQSKKRIAKLRRAGCKVTQRRLPSGDIAVLKKCPPGVRPNPEDCPECYAENQIGGAGTALVIGGLALLGLFLFTRRGEAAPAAVPAAACAIDQQKLDRWGQARGFPLLYLPSSLAPPTVESVFNDVFPNLQPGTQVVVVLQDGSFWYYTETEVSPGFPLTGRADNLRADYCSFPEEEPPLAPPPPPTT